MPKNVIKNLRVIELEHLPIELYKLLKYENLAQSGGEAKMLISEGYVKVNGEVETRKAKKIFAEDVVSFADDHMKIVQKEKS
ncbi:MAG: RNA-binding S4 domain-containing protein [Anaerolineae bacterium]|nr:RNA-binding S4 domain-containing protein [Anaerolineae bacterium]